jgi:hypothetical protein
VQDKPKPKNRQHPKQRLVSQKPNRDTNTNTLNKTHDKTKTANTAHMRALPLANIPEVFVVLAWN